MTAHLYPDANRGTVMTSKLIQALGGETMTKKIKAMNNVYFNMDTRRLRKLRSKKYCELMALEAKRMGYFDLQRVRVLKQQLKWIDEVLGSRIDQLPLL